MPLFAACLIMLVIFNVSLRAEKPETDPVDGFSAHPESLGKPPGQERVQQIAEFLAGSPSGVGPSITNREAWAGFPNAEAIKKWAQSYLDAPIPELPDDLYLSFGKTGDRKAYEIPFSRRKMRLTAFVLAECLENEGQYLPAIEGELDAMLAERSWTLPAHDKSLKSFNGSPVADLAATHRAWIVATADWLLGDKLKPETRDRIRLEVRRRVLDPYKELVLGDLPPAGKGVTVDYWLMAEHNWNSVCHAGVIGSALALVDSPKERAWFLASMENFLPFYLKGFQEDGYCSEGLGYWNYGFGHYVLLADAVGKATGWKIDLFAPEKVKVILSYPNRLELIPGVYPAFSDMGFTVRPTPWIFQTAAARETIAASREVTPVANKLPLVEAIAASFPPPGTPSVVPSHPVGPTLRDSFAGSGVVIGRPAHVGKGLAFAAKAGNNDEYHNHNDIGSFVVALDEIPLLIDPGAEIYTARTFGPRRYQSKVINSYGHSVPVVNGQLQATGARARGTITDSRLSDAEDIYTMDLTRAYAVPGLKKLTRQFRYVRSPESAVEVTDEVEFEETGTFETALITFGKIKSSTDGGWHLSADNATADIRIDTGGQPFSVEEEILDEDLPSGQKPRRIGIRLDQAVRNATIRYSVTPVKESKQSR